MSNRISIEADLPYELVEPFLQHVRDFDTANSDCHFVLIAHVPDASVTEIEGMADRLQLNTLRTRFTKN